jgi:predicted MFS family arabinose efflux permease
MPEQGSILEDIWAGLAYALRTPPIPALLLIVIAEMPGGVIITLIPVYARDVLEVGPIGFGVLSASLGAGFLAGSMVATAVGDFPRKGLVLLVTAAMWDVSMATFAFSRVYPLSAALLFIMGVGGAIHVNLLITMLQTRASDEMRGRVMSIYSLALASLPLGFILGGALAALVSNEFALVVSGLLSTPLIIVVYLRSPHLRQA